MISKSVHKCPAVAALEKISKYERCIDTSRCGWPLHYDALASKSYALADLHKVPADALMLFDSVTKQAAAHRNNFTCRVDLKTDGLFCIVQRFGRGGPTPDQCLAEWGLENGLRAIVLAVRKLQFLHKKGQFQGGVRCDTIMLVKGAINEVDFTDWSSHCELGSSRFTVHAKPYYGKLATAEATPAALA